MKPIITREIIANWFISRGKQDLQYQFECLQSINDHLFTKSTPAVLAACPSAGKSAMTIAYCEFYLKAFPKAKILILTHGTTILRNQFSNDIDELNPKFSCSEYATPEKPMDSEKPLIRINVLQIKNFDAQVIVAIPQTLKTVRRLPKFDLIVVDEAHHFYFAKLKHVDGQVMKLIKNVKPKHQILLTGTPSKFILEKFKIIPITVNQLLEYNRVSDVTVEMASSTYNFTNNDYNIDKELKTDVQILKRDTNATLDVLIEQILNRLKSIFKNDPIAYSSIKRITGWNGALKNLKKTMIACKNQAQAQQVYEYLKSRDIDVALSISDVDQDSKKIKRFVEESKCLVLVVVNRGILGFNLPELENVIDMTCSQNPDVIFQLMGRVLRPHPNGDRKLFFKVVPHTMAEWFDHLMTLVLCLTDADYYTKYNGKNFLDMEIPIVREKRKTTLRKVKNNSSKTKVDFKKVDFEGVPAIKFFNDLLHKNRSVLNGYEWTTIRQVRDKILLHKKVTTIDELIAELEEIHNE